MIQPVRAAGRVQKQPALLLYGVIAALTGMASFCISALLLPLLLVAGVPLQESKAGLALWIAGSLLIGLGALLAALDLFVLLPRKRQRRLVRYHRIDNRALTVVLTAYNDELSIGLAVRDFQSHPLVKRVIVVDNNSSDATAEVARSAGAQVVVEPQPGYGKCVCRALAEGSQQTDTNLTLLCEGDMTFRAADIDKFMAYIPHAEIVNGTRIVEQLRAEETQLTTFMYYGNFFVGKLLEAKHIGHGTFTDVGTTYKLCRNDALHRLLPLLNSDINLEFNAYFLDSALRHGLGLVECPITFHQRVGRSKGGNTDNWRAARVGLNMLSGLLIGWPEKAWRPVAGQGLGCATVKEQTN